MNCEELGSKTLRFDLSELVHQQLSKVTGTLAQKYFVNFTSGKPKITTIKITPTFSEVSAPTEVSESVRTVDFIWLSEDLTIRLDVSRHA